MEKSQNPAQNPKQQPKHKQQPKQNKVKNLQIQCLFLIKQLQEYLHKSMHRSAIEKVQKMFTNSHKLIIHLPGEVFIRILFLESKAVLKLLEKNVYRKYLHEDSVVRSLLKILNRNNTICSGMIINKIQSKQILEDKSQAFSWHRQYQNLPQLCSELSQQCFSHITKQFNEIYLSSLIYELANFKLYHLHVHNWPQIIELIDYLVWNNPQFSFKTQFSLVMLKVTLVRWMFERGNYTNAKKMVDKVIENLLSLHYKVRVWGDKVQIGNVEYNEKIKVGKKRKYYMRKVTKLLLVASILMVRVNMKLSLQNLAIQSIKIFNFILQKNDNDLVYFRKYLNPQVYIFNQYCQYRAEKFQIQKIIEPIFLKKVDEIINNHKSQHQLLGRTDQGSKEPIYQFYNERMMEFRDKLQAKDRKAVLKRVARDSNRNVESRRDDGEPFPLGETVVRLATRNKHQLLVSSSSKAQQKTRNSPMLSSGLQSSQCSFPTQNQTTRPNSSINSNLLNFEKSVIDQLLRSNQNYMTQRNHKNSRQMGRFGFNLARGNGSLVKRGSNVKGNGVDNNVKKLSSEDKENSSSYGNKQQENKRKGLVLATRLITNFITTIPTPHPPSLPNKDTHLVKSPTLKPHPTPPKPIIQCKQGTQLLQSKQSRRIMQQGHKLRVLQRQLVLQLGRSVQLLKQKKNSKLNELTQNYHPEETYLDQSQPHISQLSDSFIEEKYKHILEDPHDELQRQKATASTDNKNSIEQRLSHKVSSTYINHKYKDKLKHLNKKTKLQLFIELLGQNKEYLGVKKWSEKIQYLKKKEEMKEKLRSTRKTTSINYNTIPGLSPQMTIIAGNILRYSLQQIQQFGLNSAQALNKKIQRHQSISKANNQNNYKLGQKSIQMLMNKLQKEKEALIKLRKSEHVGSASHERKREDRHRTFDGKKTRSQWHCKFML